MAGAAPLRVLAVTNLWPVDGGFRGVFVREQVEALRGLGHRVDVEVVAQRRGRADYLLAAGRVRRRVRAGDYHLVHVHYGLTALASRLVTGVPRVLSLYGSDVNEPWQRRVTRLTAGRPAVRVYPSRRLAAAAGDPDGPVVPNGVDFSVFAPVDRSAARAALGLDGAEPVVLFGAAPDNPVKDYDLFTEVLAAVRAGGLPVRELVLAAAGQTRRQVAERFAAADVLLVTSRRGTESGPLVVKEAAAMGLPVVSVDVGDVAEVLDGVTPSAVVPFPPAEAGSARDRLVAALARQVSEVLAAGRRSNGRQRLGWLETGAVTRRLVDVYRAALR